MNRERWKGILNAGRYLLGNDCPKMKIVIETMKTIVGIYSCISSTSVRLGLDIFFCQFARIDLLGVLGRSFIEMLLGRKIPVRWWQIEACDISTIFIELLKATLLHDLTVAIKCDNMVAIG
jgi:hypothetical protein